MGGNNVFPYLADILPRMGRRPNLQAVIIQLVELFHHDYRIKSLWKRLTVVGISQLRQMFSPDDTAVDKLLKVAEMTMASSCDCPPEVGRMQLEFMVAASRMESLEPDMQKRYETIHTFIREIFEEGVENGEFKEDLDSQSLTSLLFASLDGLGLHYATLGIEFDAKRLQDTLMKVVLEGILA